jgi:hypothetical protein
MGLETAVIVMAAVSAGATVGKMGFEMQAANDREKALDLQAEQQTLQYQQKTLSNLDVMEKVVDAQTAAMTTRGVAFSSPSFNAIQRATLNIGAKKQSNTEVENDLSQENIDIEKQNVRNSLYAQLFGDVSNLAMQGASLYAKMPTGGGGGSAAAAPSSLPQMEA